LPQRSTERRNSKQEEKPQEIKPQQQNKGKENKQRFNPIELSQEEIKNIVKSKPFISFFEKTSKLIEKVNSAYCVLIIDLRRKKC